MALSAENLRRISFGGSTAAGQQNGLWALSTNDAAAAVDAANYFDSFAAQLKVGDLILGSLDLDGTPVPRIYMVTANSGTVVTVSAYPIV